MKEKPDLVPGLAEESRQRFGRDEGFGAGGRFGRGVFFHAQQAAEKYLRAYLAEREREILHTHNLYKLVNLCGNRFIVPRTDRRSGDADAFAVVARYATEFWPTSGTVEHAELAKNRIAQFVSARVQWIAWKAARDQYTTSTLSTARNNS